MRLIADRLIWSPDSAVGCLLWRGQSSPGYSPSQSPQSALFSSHSSSSVFLSAPITTRSRFGPKFRWNKWREFRQMHRWDKQLPSAWGLLFFWRGGDVYKTISAGGLWQVCWNWALCVPFIFTALVLARATWFVVLQMRHVGGIQADPPSLPGCHPLPENGWNFFLRLLWI